MIDYSSSKYLIAAMSKAQISAMVRGQCISEELGRLDEILEKWESAAKKLREIETKENGIVENILQEDMQINEKIEKIQSEELFKKSFSKFPYTFKIVEIDSLIAVQRKVSEMYVSKIMEKISDNPNLDELIEICLSSKQDFPIPQSFHVNQNSYTFSSPSMDFRFLGGYLKEKVTEDDVKYSAVGGFPIGALILLFGYGAGTINILSAKGRLFLNNGFHRVIALRKKGVKKIPVVVQNIGNPDIEMPPQIHGLPKNYLLNHQRPILVKDFLDDDLTTTLQMKKTLRTLKIQWDVEQHDMAI